MACHSQIVLQSLDLRNAPTRIIFRCGYLVCEAILSPCGFLSKMKSQGSRVQETPDIALLALFQHLSDES
jgi:hypothetical protein